LRRHCERIGSGFKVHSSELSVRRLTAIQIEIEIGIKIGIKIDCDTDTDFDNISPISRKIKFSAMPSALKREL